MLEVEYIFGLPGGAIEPLFNAFARSERRGGPRVIVSRHETGAAFMADGYARNSGRLGVCCSTTGPGATNLITGVSSAYENNIPLLVITAQTALQKFGQNALQESSDTGVNTLGMFQFCTKYNTMISHVAQFERKLISAILVAMNDRCPVHISVPLDIIRTTVTTTKLYDIRPRFSSFEINQPRYVEELGKQLAAAKQTVFVVGPECKEAISLIQKCAFLLDAKIITTPDGKGLISPYHPLFYGVIGFAGHIEAKKLLSSDDVDFIVAVGTPLGEFATDCWDVSTLFNERLIYIDPNATNLSRVPVAHMHLHGHAKPVFQTLLEELNKVSNTTKRKVEEGTASQEITLPGIDERSLNLKEGWETRPVPPQWLMHKLPNKLPRYTRFLTDSGNAMALGIHYLHPYDRRIAERRMSAHEDSSPRRSAFAGLFQTTIEFASMGWAIGASIGASMANPRQLVVCITGDGALLMSGQEMTVALEHDLPVLFIILNDSAFGMVKHGQRLTGAEQIAHTLPKVDFAMMAQSMGIQGITIRCPQDLIDLDINAKLKGGGPMLLDVIVDPEEVPPISSRTRELKPDTTGIEVK